MDTVAFRYANYRTPLRVLPATTDQRFSRSSDGQPTQYFAEHPLGAWAEFLRWTPSTSLSTVATRLWAVQVDTEKLVEVTFDNSRTFGLAPDRLIADDDYSDCQDLADELRERPAPGMIVPSAALPGIRNIVIFGPRVLSPWLQQPADADHLAGTLIADHARPPVEIGAMFRERRRPHAAYEAWKAGADFTFREPTSFRYPA